MLRRAIILVALTVGFACSLVSKGGDEQREEALNVSLASTEMGVPETISAFKSVLSTLHPKTTRLPVVETLKPPANGDRVKALRGEESNTGRQVLYGDLFHDGSTYAVVELSDGDSQGGLGTGLDIGVGFAQWNGKNWEIRQMLRVVPVWRPKGWKPAGELKDEGFPIRPAEKPFWLQDFNGDGIPELMIADALLHHSQAYDLFKFDRDKKCLKFIEGFRTLPEVANGWISVSFDSGRKAWFYGNKFYRWSNEKLVLRLRWHIQDDNEKNAPYWLLSIFDASGKAGDNYFIKELNPDTGAAQHYEIVLNDKAKCELSLEWKKKDTPPPKSGQAELPTDFLRDELVQAYLFEKLSGQPHSLLPIDDKLSKIHLDDCAIIKVTGDADLLRRISPAK